jgi:hypothetical protein
MAIMKSKRRKPIQPQRRTVRSAPRPGRAAAARRGIACQIGRTSVRLVIDAANDEQSEFDVADKVTA